ncbi:MAG: VOC family protein [Deltaproteobacteria bacterium]|jgi:lactoylglutathione lyase|nr:VOC family protein [Syntrophaceae bacterium]
MKFIFSHNNFNVLDLEKSLAFYKEALSLVEMRRYEPPDKSFIIVYLGDGVTPHYLELTWLRDRREPYNLGDNEFHLALKVEDFAAAHTLHEKMGCICFENPKMGIYFINDPDDYWIEIVPARR